MLDWRTSVTDLDEREVFAALESEKGAFRRAATITLEIGMGLDVVESILKRNPIFPRG